jgi:hypothetical protein
MIYVVALQHNQLIDITVCLCCTMLQMACGNCGILTTWHRCGGVKNLKNKKTKKIIIYCKKRTYLASVAVLPNFSLYGTLFAGYYTACGTVSLGRSAWV